MDDFAQLLLSSCDQLQKKDCLPISDTGVRVVYGYQWSPFILEIEFNLKYMTIKRLLIQSWLQNQGLGKVIVTYLKRECGRLELKEIRLDTVLREARNFWINHDFQLNGTYDGCSGQWQCTPFEAEAT